MKLLFSCSSFIRTTFLKLDSTSTSRGSPMHQLLPESDKKKQIQFCPQSIPDDE